MYLVEAPSGRRSLSPQSIAETVLGINSAVSEQETRCPQNLPDEFLNITDMTSGDPPKMCLEVHPPRLNTEQNTYTNEAAM